MDRLFLIPTHFRLSNINHCLAFGFGSGLFKKAPGTWGSLAAVIIYSWLLAGHPVFLSGAIVGGFFLGIYVCEKTAQDLGVHDYGGIVWDEFIGQWIALAFLFFLDLNPANWTYLALAFWFFRGFDIVKPWPIAWFDKHTQGGLGIMIDDVIAGVFAGLSLCVCKLVGLI